MTPGNNQADFTREAEVDKEVLQADHQEVQVEVDMQEEQEVEVVEMEKGKRRKRVY